jgi:NAD(P)H dehydrogenase (quinone)
VIRGPAGAGVVSAVSRGDVARSAVTVLRDPALHVGTTYNLTGPQELTLAAAADILTAETGRGITYHPETVEEAYASRASYGAPAWQLDAWVSTYTAIAAGELAGLSPDVRTLTGQEPLSFAAFLQQPQL